MSQSKSMKKKWIGSTAMCTKCGHTWTVSASDDLRFMAAGNAPDDAAIAICPKDGAEATLKKPILP